MNIEDLIERLSFIPSDACGVLLIEVPDHVLVRNENAQAFIKQFNAGLHTRCPGVDAVLLRHGTKCRLEDK